MLELLIALVLQRVDNPEIIPVLRCESGIEHYKEDGSILTGAHGEVGIAQFLPSTWEWMTKTRGVELNIRNPLAQINMMDWAFTNGLAHHWTCYNKIYKSHG